MSWLGRRDCRSRIHLALNKPELKGSFSISPGISGLVLKVTSSGTQHFFRRRLVFFGEPLLRHEQLVAHQVAGVPDKDRRLAVLCLAQASAMLSDHTDRVVPLLNKLRAVDALACPPGH